MKTTLEWARFYVSHGLSVIALEPRGKKPLLTHWKDYQARRATDEELLKWFGGGSSANIGIVTGSISNVDAIDFDSEAALNFANENHFPSGPLVKTSKGYHAYYLHHKGARNFQKRDDLPGLDLRADGGYVVAPPSFHPSGVQYSWIKGRDLDYPMAELPDIILQKRPEHKTPIAELYHGSTKGTRNITLARLCGSWVNDGLDFEECVEQAEIWNAKNKPPLDRNEIITTVESIFDKHHREHKEDESMRPIHISELLAEPDEQITMIVDGMLPTEGFSVCVAKPKVGKSTLMRNLALAVARGDDFLGRKTNAGPVIYFSLEEKRQEVKNHFRSMGVDHQDELYVYVGRTLKNSMREIEKAINDIKPVLTIIDPLFKVARVKDLNAGYTEIQDELDKLLWLGRTSKTHIASTHHAGKGDRGGIDAILGSTAIAGSVDTAIHLKKTETYRTVETIQRYGTDLQETTLAFDGVAGSVTIGASRRDVDREASEKAIIEFLGAQNEPAPESVIGEEVQGTRAVKCPALRNLVKNGKVERTGKGSKGDPFRYALKPP